jgi:hypothetical protein
MRCKRNSDDRTISAALRLWLEAAICVCLFVVIVVATIPVASAEAVSQRAVSVDVASAQAVPAVALWAADQAPQPQLAFDRTPPSLPPLNLSDDPEIMTTDGAHALTPVSLRSAGCDQSTRAHLPLAEPMLDRSEPPQLRPPIAA